MQRLYIDWKLNTNRTSNRSNFSKITKNCKEMYKLFTVVTEMLSIFNVWVRNYVRDVSLILFIYLLFDLIHKTPIQHSYFLKVLSC